MGNQAAPRRILLTLMPPMGSDLFFHIARLCWIAHTAIYNESVITCVSVGYAVFCGLKIAPCPLLKFSPPAPLKVSCFQLSKLWRALSQCSDAKCEIHAHLISFKDQMKANVVFLFCSLAFTQQFARCWLQART